MDCEQSWSLLSDFRDGALDDDHRALLSRHLDGCPPCACILKDIETIIITARSFSTDNGLEYPDEETFWQRITVTRRAVH